jgi:hypothetical protein
MERPRTEQQVPTLMLSSTEAKDRFRASWAATPPGCSWPLAAEAEPQLSTVPIPADFRVRPERPELSARLTAIVISH